MAVEEQPWCVCTDGEQLCGVDASSQSCAAAGRRRRSQGTDITLDLLKTSSQNPPNRCLTRQPPVQFQFDINYSFAVGTWPTSTGITLEMAVTSCRSQIEANLSAGACGKIVSADLTAAIDTCVEDVQITESLTWVASAFKTLLQMCSTSIEFDLSLWKQVTINGTVVDEPPTDIFDTILCPSNCTGHGLCVEGQCQCQGNFSGDDCALDLGNPPVVFPTDKACDRLEDSCLNVTVFGSGFVSSTDLVCFVQELTITQDGFVQQDTEATPVTASFISSQQVICSLRKVGIYNISISNRRDLRFSSTFITYVSYDSGCYNCSLTGCTKNSGVCVINGTCYGDGFVNLFNPTQRCTNGSSVWTIIKKEEIVSKTYNFLSIDGTVLVTTSGNVTAIGAPVLNSQAVELNGVDQYLDFTNATSLCAFKPEACLLGLSVTFNLKLKQVLGDEYIFTSGGDEENGQGLSLYFHLGRLFLTVSTKDLVWSVSVPTSVLRLNVFMSIEFSWSRQSGLELLVDRVVVARTTTYIRRQILGVSRTNFFVGRSLGFPANRSVFAGIAIEAWSFTHSTRQVRDALLPVESTTVLTTTSPAANATTVATQSNTTSTGTMSTVNVTGVLNATEGVTSVTDFMTTSVSNVTGIGTTGSLSTISATIVTNSTQNATLSSVTGAANTTGTGTNTIQPTTVPTVTGFTNATGRSETLITSGTTATVPTSGTAGTFTTLAQVSGLPSQQVNTTTMPTAINQTQTTVLLRNTTSVSQQPIVNQTQTTISYNTTSISTQPAMNQTQTTVFQLNTTTSISSQLPISQTQTTVSLLNTTSISTQQAINQTQTTVSLRTTTSLVNQTQSIVPLLNTTVSLQPAVNQTQTTASLLNTSSTPSQPAINQTQPSRPELNTTAIVQTQLPANQTQSTVFTLMTTTSVQTRAGTSLSSSSISSDPQTTQMPLTSTAAITTAAMTTLSSTSTPCIASTTGYPNMTGPPTVSNAVLSSSVRFDCTVRPASLASTTYTVEWSSGGVVLLSSDLTGSATVHSLDSSSLNQASRNSILDNGITCSVTAISTALCGYIRSPPLSSSLAPTKLQVVLPSQALVRASEIITVSVGFKNSVTASFYCLLKYGRMCTVELEARTSQSRPWKCIGSLSIQALVVKSVSPTGSEVCGTQLSASSTSMQELLLRAVVNNIVRSQVKVEVEVSQVDIVNGQRTYTSILNKFDVNVESAYKRDSHCFIYADPHFKTFDGVYYDVMRPGPFVIYKNKLFPVEVEGYFQVVGRGVQACGYGIRSADDVIRVSRCNSPLTTKIFLNGNLTPGTRIYQEDEGNIIKVLLPTGTVAIVTAGTQTELGLEIRPSVLDVNQTQGLCGVFDGNILNDLTSRYDRVTPVTSSRITRDPNDFSMTWINDESQSFYGGFKGTASFDTSTYCTCERSKLISCSPQGYISDCGVSISGKEITQTLLEDHYQTRAVQNLQRRKRQTTGEVFTYDPYFNASDSATWPTQSGKTESQARAACSNRVISSQAYLQCKDFSPDNFTTEIENCVRDVQLTDNLDWSDSALQTAQKLCGSTIATDSNLWVDSNPTDESVPATIQSNIANTLCQNQCSGHGSCQNGVCSCDSKYGGIDCSFEKSQAPTVDVVFSSVMCQTNLGSCNRTIVRGYNFMNLLPGFLSCHLTPIQVDQTGWTRSGPSVTVSAEYRSRYEVVCNLPAERSYTIAISNDQRSTSISEALFLTYDSQCFVCSISNDSQSATCTLKPLTCFIGGMCFLEKQKNPADSCLACQPSKSQTSWTQANALGCTTSTSSSTTVKLASDQASRFRSETIIIAVSISAVVFVLIVIAVVAYIVRRRRGSRSLTRSTISEEASQYEHVYDGSRGLRTEKGLTFTNPTVYENYTPSI
ncbi:uncharacterized protein LOC112565098 isoform X2 [Pomacea canaliculata]|uniref:uncharacterized protein LOC112565098 isoform X2 n=1 Tax=Pomacea canaliculata TaxID=400727 RepID=UPI000D728726|nr:uncharacterized protein LOC112565098 isoform X2 [Pomacea canaliculata]